MAELYRITPTGRGLLSKWEKGTLESADTPPFPGVMILDHLRNVGTDTRDSLYRFNDYITWAEPYGETSGAIWYLLKNRYMTGV